MKRKEKLRKCWDRICLYYLYLPSILLGISIFNPHRMIKTVFMILAIVTALFDLFRYFYKEKKRSEFPISKMKAETYNRKIIKRPIEGRTWKRGRRDGFHFTDSGR